ncbi:MAG: amidase [Geminicoccaceae bacterium]
MKEASDPALLSLVELAGKLRSKAISPVEITRHMLDRIERLEPNLHAYALVTAEAALEEAHVAESEIMAGRYRGLLHGVPIAVKDLCLTKGVTTACGTTILKSWQPEIDATVVERLRVSGAVSLGKLQMTEGAFADHHPAIQPPLNPWHPAHWSGASSSGSGVATAASLCFGSLGSDTGGSIRFPSTANGVTGLKPTWGRVSRYGVFPLADSLDHIGPMTRTAADAAAMLAAIAGEDANDPTSLVAPVPDYLAGLAQGVLGARGLRIGIDTSFNSEGVEARVVEVVEAAARVFDRLGATLVDVAMPDTGKVVENWAPFCAVETAIAHKATYPSRADEYGGTLAGLIDLGHGLTARQLGEIMIERDRFKGRLVRLFGQVDLMLIPAMYLAGPTFERMSRLSDPAELAMLLKFTSPFDVSGSPTITLQGGFSDEGLPVGFQLVGPHLSEDVLLRAGHAYQQETDWHTRHPSL